MVDGDKYARAAPLSMAISAKRRAKPLPVELLQYPGVAQHQAVLQRRVTSRVIPDAVKRQQHGESLQLGRARQRQDIVGPRLVGTLSKPARLAENNIFAAGQRPQRIDGADPVREKRTWGLALHRQRLPHPSRQVAYQVAQGEPSQPLGLNGGNRNGLAAAGMASRTASRDASRGRDRPVHAPVDNGPGLDQRREPGQTRGGVAHSPQGQHRHSAATLRHHKTKSIPTIFSIKLLQQRQYNHCIPRKSSKTRNKLSTQRDISSQSLAIVKTPKQCQPNKSPFNLSLRRHPHAMGQDVAAHLPPVGKAAARRIDKTSWPRCLARPSRHGRAKKSPDMRQAKAAAKKKGLSPLFALPRPINPGWLGQTPLPNG